LWDTRIAGKITMLDESSEVLGVCLQMLGYSLNSGDPMELRLAQQEALRQKQMVRAYLNAEVRDQLVAGDVLAAQTWSITASQAMSAAPDKMSYAFPEEGFPRYADTTAILRESTRTDSAHQFLNYLLQPEVAAKIARAIRTATVNAGALRLLSPEERGNPVLYPPPETLARGEWFTPQSAASQRLRDRLWTEIKSA
jgi:spermidine/putrescine transport system substrate-binding protein